MTERARLDWSQMIASGRAGQKLLEGEPLRLYYGIDLAGRAVFLLVSAVRSEAPKMGDSIGVEHGRRSDGSWTVVLTLLDDSLLETFMGLCMELARRTNGASDESAALRLFETTLHQWRRLLVTTDKRRLTDIEIRGAFAELWFLRDRAGFQTLEVALKAWTGPMGSPHDFRFGGGEIYEVKAIRTGALTVHISSLDQLEHGETDQLTLVVVTLNEVPTASSLTLTLADLAHLLFDEVATSVEQSGLLQDRLDALGLDPLDPSYQTTHFEVGEVVGYGVRTGFPRVLSDAAPLGVVRVKYELEIKSLSKFIASGFSLSNVR